MLVGDQSLSPMMVWLPTLYLPSVEAHKYGVNGAAAGFASVRSLPFFTRAITQPCQPAVEYALAR